MSEISNSYHPLLYTSSIVDDEGRAFLGNNYCPSIVDSPIASSPDPAVTIGLSISTSPASLSLSSSEPFHIVLTAKVLTSARPEVPITLATHQNAFDSIPTEGLTNIECTTDPSKKITIRPAGPPQYRYDMQNLAKVFDFVTIPATGSMTVTLSVPSERISAAELRVGERYKLSLDRRYLGTRWWTYGDVDVLKGHRIVAWSGESADEAAERETKQDQQPAWYVEELEQERFKKWGADYKSVPTFQGEQPSMLVLVQEVGEVEFEITE